MEYQGRNGTAGTYAVTLTLEDYPAGTTNFNNVRPFGAVPLQFLVIITSLAGSCDDIPVFTDSTPQDGECSEVQIGSAYKIAIEVKLTDFAKQLVIEFLDVFMFNIIMHLFFFSFFLFYH